MTKRALVTGARGFIGRHVCRELKKRSYAVDGMGRGEWSSVERLQWGAERWISGELGARVLPDESYDLVVHCAGGSSVGKSVKAPFEDFEQTLPGLAALLEWMRTGPSRAARLVIPSSAAVYGACEVQPIAETSPMNPISPYGSFKAMSEELCRTFALNYGLSIAIVRLFSVYGPGLERQLLWDACRKAKAGEHRFSGTGNEKRDWLHVSDACNLLLTAAEKASPSAPVINGGSGKATRVTDLVHRVFTALGIASPPVFDGVARAGDPPDYVADLRRALALGWQPTVDIAAGVAEYAGWFKGLS